MKGYEHRPGLKLALPTDRGVSILRGQEDLLRKALNRVELSDREIEQAMALYDLQNEHVEAGIQIIAGGRIKLAQTVLSDIERIRKRLEALENVQYDSEKPETNPILIAQQVRELSRQLNISIKLYAEFARDVEKGAIGWATVEATREATEAEIRKPKVGFNPIALQVNVKGENVELKDGTSKPT